MACRWAICIAAAELQHDPRVERAGTPRHGDVARARAEVETGDAIVVTSRHEFSRADLESQIGVRGRLEGQTAAATEDRPHFDDRSEETHRAGLADGDESRREFGDHDEQGSPAQQRQQEDDATAARRQGITVSRGCS